MPVIEGTVRRIASKQGRDFGEHSGEVRAEFVRFVEKEAASPHCYGERVVMLEALRDFVQDRLLKKTNDYAGYNQFNRHGIFHGLYTSFGEEINFFRMITLLDLLCFVIGLADGGVSMFASEPTMESRGLAKYYEYLSSIKKYEII